MGAEQFDGRGGVGAAHTLCVSGVQLDLHVLRDDHGGFGDATSGGGDRCSFRNACRGAWRWRRPPLIAENKALTGDLSAHLPAGLSYYPRIVLVYYCPKMGRPADC